MDTRDINLHESGSGGEIAIVSNDLLMSEMLYQQVYLALFGGNIESNTKNDVLRGEERFDYWANSLVWQTQPTRQFNSNTERTIQNIVLNSSGRLELLRAVNDDLQYLSNLLNFTVDVQFVDSNKVRIIVNFTAKGNQEDKVLQLVYDNAKGELIIEKII